MFLTKDILIYFSTTVTAVLRGLRPRHRDAVLSVDPHPLDYPVFILNQTPTPRCCSQC